MFCPNLGRLTGVGEGCREQEEAGTFLSNISSYPELSEFVGSLGGFLPVPGTTLSRYFNLLHSSGRARLL